MKEIENKNSVSHCQENKAMTYAQKCILEKIVQKKTEEKSFQDCIEYDDYYDCQIMTM